MEHASFSSLSLLRCLSFPVSNSAARFTDYLLRSLFYRFCLTRKKKTYRLTQYFGLMTLVSFVLVLKLKTE